MPGSDTCSYDARCAKLADLKRVVINGAYKVDLIKHTHDMGDYIIAVSSIDTTARRALIEVQGIYQVGTGRATQTKILGEGTSYTFFGSDIGGGINVKVNSVMPGIADLTITYKSSDIDEQMGWEEVNLGVPS